MTRPHRRAAAAAQLLAAVALLALPGGTNAAETLDEPAVTGAVQVTGNPNHVRAHVTPQVVRSRKTGELVVAEVDSRGTRECNVNISVDGGRSWFQGGTFMVRPYTDCSIGAEFGAHAVPFFDNQGVLYVAFTANDPTRLLDSSRPVSTTDVREDIPRNAYLARSTDGGRTFETFLVAAGKDGSTQTAYLSAPSGAVDGNDPRYVYVAWGQGDWSNQQDAIKAMVSVSSDGGRTWSAPFDLADGKGADYSWVTVDRNGRAHAVYWTRGVGTEAADPAQARPGGRKEPTPIYHMFSDDHGATWSRQVLDPGNQRLYRSPVLAADPSSDTIYAAWHGFPDPINFQLNRDRKDPPEIFMRVSTDGGQTWSDRQVVNDDAGRGVIHELPGISVAPNGRVDIAWYDYRHNSRTTGAGMQDVYYTYSTDQGRTFAPNVRITDRSIDRAIGVYAGSVGANINVGITSTDDEVFFAWQDSRNGRVDTQAEDIYSASLRFGGAAATGAVETSETSGWLILGAGVAAGAGLAMAGVWAMGRSRPAARPAATAT